uniref:Hydroxynitrile lyase n=1 Tax=Oxidus gracilis TaxID=291247 RepID=A0A2Z5XCT7_9MYRI|nr:Chain A, Hydroxynitrile lyase [Oxidus gracilis]7YAX_B Chain B, Hydroxynitrile lyase [Oxidus gracilis]7YAX_C Chain C, Hydroxynitrile lyase [Oxidus gracilis]7YAX_D Chain D, Hydroxynitrile lyase [Oxidus gracilis]BBC44055.1 hydroxynitrile lyase [Oxidus gracilis]
MLYYVSILLMAVYAVAVADEDPMTCDKLPKVPVPPLEEFIKSNPLQFAYVLTDTFDCTTRVYVQPARLSPNQAATALDIRGSRIITNDFVGGPNNSAILNNCTTGEKATWYFQYTNLNTPNGSSYCAYTCNGEEIAEYKCANNNNGTDPLQKQAVEVAKKVPNGDKIHYALDNCPEHHGCFAFY